MLGDNTVFTQWENGNGLRKFPFTESSSLVSTDGQILPDNVITDLLLFYPTSEYTPQLACVKLGPEVLSVAFKLGNTLLTSVIVTKKDFKAYMPYQMTSVLPGSTGIITFGEIRWPETATLYKFDGTATVDMRACISSPQPGVTAFVDDVSGEELSGIVELILPTFVEATITKVSGVAHVTFDLTAAGKTAIANPCNAGTDEEVCGVPVIRSINGVKPNSSGQIMLRFV